MIRGFLGVVGKADLLNKRKIKFMFIMLKYYTVEKEVCGIS